MAPRRSRTGRRSEPGGSKHPGLAQRKGDPHSIPSFPSNDLTLNVILLYYGVPPTFFDVVTIFNYSSNPGDWRANYPDGGQWAGGGRPHHPRHGPGRSPTPLLQFFPLAY